MSVISLQCEAEARGLQVQAKPAQLSDLIRPSLKDKTKQNTANDLNAVSGIHCPFLFLEKVYCKTGVFRNKGVLGYFIVCPLCILSYLIP